MYEEQKQLLWKYSVIQIKKKMFLNKYKHWGGKSKLECESFDIIFSYVTVRYLRYLIEGHALSIVTGYNGSIEWRRMKKSNLFLLPNVCW